MPKSVEIENDGLNALRIDLTDKGAVHISIGEDGIITIDAMNHVTMEEKVVKLDVHDYIITDASQQ